MSYKSNPARRLTLLAALNLSLPLLAQPLLTEAPVPSAPPPSFPAVSRTPQPGSPALRPQGPTLYSIGNPTGEEQLYLEYINRARANPPAEGVLLANTTDPEVTSAYDFFGVNLVTMMNEFAAINPAPPLSFNAELIEAARLHSGDMFTNVFQGHYTWNPATGAMDSSKSPGYRMDLVGYDWISYGENVFSYAKSAWHGHAGFEVDWGFGPDGMQGPPRGHRESIHNPNFREVGIGIVTGSNETNTNPPRDPVGPSLVTQDFGSRANLNPFITGVAYYDLNGNGAYDANEGIGGASVDVAGSQYYALTANSGGYSVPVPKNLTHTVTFSGANFADDVRTVAVSSSNVKLDFAMPYPAPALSGPSQLGLNASGTYTFQAVGGATSYRWSKSLLAPYNVIEGAENGSDHLDVAISTGYALITSTVKASGTSSFHLVTPEYADQVLGLTNTIRPGPAGELVFASRLGWAAPGQVARAQVSLDDGESWNDLWTRAGTDSAGQTSFQTITASLAAYAGQVVRIRFCYTVSGSYYPQTDSGIGWYIDDIRFNDCSSLEAVVTQEIASPSISFSGNTEGTYLLQAQPQISGRWFPMGPVTLVDVSATVTPPSVTIGAIQLNNPGSARIECLVENGPPSSIQLQYSNDDGTTWTTDTTTQAQEVTPGSAYAFDLTPPIGNPPTRAQLYRIRIE
ncbi:MAG: CAP domain-containing protein [Limisphaerales bacterium]